MTDSDNPAEKIIAEAKLLFKNGKGDDAQNLLLDEGYVRRLEPSIQKAYLKLVPIGPTLQAILDEMYSKLDDSDAKIRLKAVTQIAREFNKERLRDNVRWMRDPRASGPLIDAVNDRHPGVSERALGALSRLVCKYFPDQRALPAFLDKLTDKREAFRTFAISGVGCLRREELLDHLVDLLEHGTDKDRSGVSAQIWGASFETFHHMRQHPIVWTPKGRQFWRDKMIGALADSCVTVKNNAARALKELGDMTTVPKLQEARSAESDVDTIFYIDEAITRIKERFA